jgi:hypothetical protein
MPFTMKSHTTNRLTLKALAPLILLTLPGIAYANSLTQATNTLCSKIKSCTTAQLKQQQLPPAMLQMMTAMLDESCAKTIAPYADKASNVGLEKKAVACIKSINALSCNALMNTSKAETGECKALEKAANEAGVNTNIQTSDIGIIQ